ncbi:hypothetical protein TVAG_570730 [Trichomonas vaginalis G3]|uniref:DNA-directed DNA polymerase n=1 Tax=Trichomonas vaginalis (strain ATCC PRA-98 / G3) TaxID=412133 RepID=A2GHY1_TRIV3|nr:hypothetical protein TVAG_570730 [Trichomonas vaginalis G3]|eukprot:XP_001296165.1 hypothetical protein [Trichomonas vaginalis G3]
MTEDNCFVYACIQAGVDEQTVDHMREVIRVRDFPQSKIQEISNATGIAFNVTIGYFNDSRHNEIKRYIPKECETVRTIDLLLVEDHYMLNERLPMITYFIINYNEILKSLGGWNIERQMKIYKKRENRFVIDSTRTTPLWDILKTLRECNYFEPLSYGELFTYTTYLYKQKLAPFKDLNYTPNYCVQLKKKAESKDTKPQSGETGGHEAKKKFIYEHVFFADFECSTDGVHKAFNICYDSEDGKISESIWGQNCATKFLERIPDKSLIYFHNLSYDINFILRHLTEISGTPIIKGSRTMQITGIYKGKAIIIKDSYTVINKKLKLFPEMFHLQTGPKEVFPYQYYSSSLLVNDNRTDVISEACKFVKDIETFMKNIDLIENCRIDENHFDLEKYSSFYCKQDVRILREGFVKFRNDILKEFDLNVYDYVSMCSIANKLFENRVYFPNGNLYDLSNKPREFISRCIQGGRCMMSDNMKQKSEKKLIADFDAVSLYPSAIARLYTLEGIPKVMKPEMLSSEYLLKYLFDDD